MKLFLASEVKNTQTIKKLDEYIGGLRNKTIAYVPTAANGELKYGAWETESDTWKLIQTLGANVTPVVLEEYKNNNVYDILQNKNIIWFAGGYCGYLMYWIRRCGLDKYLPDLLKAGSVYVGSSAGSMIAGPSLEVAEWYPGDIERGASLLPGLRLVDFDIYPHYEENMLPEIKQHYHGKKLYLLKNGEEIIVENNKIKVVGIVRVITSSS